MKRILFKCTLISDVVLSSQAATEGFFESLHYIPGSKFLGIAAERLYRMGEEQQTLDLFHNGVVRFSDAHPLDADGLLRSLKAPFSWQYIKGKDLTGEIFLHHRLDDAGKTRLLKEGKQRKQAQKGYFTLSGDSGKLLKGRQNFSIKSAYNEKEYRAQDQQMYGYFALKKGSAWQFEILTQKDAYEDLLKEALSGKKRMGRSGTAEYGLVEIEHQKTEDLIANRKIIPSGRVYIYAASNLCFYDEAGNTTCRPDEVRHLLLPPDSRICWKDSQIRTRKYLTWNKYRSNRDADRLIIEKGSVIAVDTSAPIEVGRLELGIGAHLSEGFGQVILNPEFLTTPDEKLPFGLIGEDLKTQTVESAPVVRGDQDEILLAFLRNRMQEVHLEKAIDAKVNEFMHPGNRRNYDGITSSQWGQVRAIAKNVEHIEHLRTLLFDQTAGLMFAGQSEPSWRPCRKMFRDFLNGSGLPDVSISSLTMKIASEMAKAAQNQEDYGQSN